MRGPAPSHICPVVMSALDGKKGLIVGIANEHSLAYGCARHMHAAGAELAITYLNAKTEPYVRPLAQTLQSEIVLPCDVTVPELIDAVYERIRKQWGRLDFLLHSIAYCPKDDLHSRVVDCSRNGFNEAMDVSVHSLIRMARLAEPLMAEGGCLLTLSYYGAEKVVDRYNIMGPVKAALVATVRYLAAELGRKGIRVNAVSPGPLKTRAASGIDHFDELINQARARAPERQLVTIEDVGAIAADLVSDSAHSVTGNIAFVDAGYHVTA